MLIKLLVGEAVLTVLSVYAPQTGLKESTKDAFYDSLQTVISDYSFFVKRDSHLITYQSGNAKTQINFILLRKRNLKMAKDIKVIPSEECVP